MTIPDAKKLRDLESENSKLKKLLAEAILDAEALKVALGQKSTKPTRQTRGCKAYVPD
jgi:putative transposase